MGSNPIGVIRAAGRAIEQGWHGPFVHPQPSRVWGPPGDALAQRSCTARLPQNVPQPRLALPRNQYVRILRVFCLHSAFSRVGFEFKEIHQ